VASQIEIKQKFENKYWRLNNLYWIIDKKGRKVRFKLNSQQERLFDDFWYLNIILKARQFGGTTFIDIYFLDECIFNDNVEAGIIAHNKDDAQKIFRRKVKYPYEHLPEGLKSRIHPTTDSRSELAFNNGSIIYVGTSMRSGTLQYLHICLAGDTGILMKNGYVKKIEDVTSGDLVLTDKGSYQRVVELIKNDSRNIPYPLLSVKTSGYYEPLKITANHEVLARERKTGKPAWKEAGDLRPGDYMAYPTREPSMKLKSESLPIDGWRGKERVKVDYSFGYFVGLYLAEGHIRRSEIGIAGDKSEDAARLRAIEPLMEHIDSLRISHREDSRTSLININSRRFADFIAANFIKDGDKYIPDAVWNWGRKFLDGLLKGYFDGDGCYKSIHEVQATSIRRQLLDQIKLILISLRFGFPSMYHRPAGKYCGRNCQEVWVLKLYGAGNWKFREYFGLDLPEVNTWAGKWRISHGRNPEGKKFWRRGRKHYWSRVISTKIIEDEPFVYDLALEGDPHNYVTVNGVVHNSEHGKICKKYPEKAEEIRTGSLNAIEAGQIVAIESTAEGAYGDFSDFCHKAMDKKAKGEPLTPMDYKFHFFAWYESEEYRIDPDGVDITEDKTVYFNNIETAMECKIDAAQRAWYVKKEETQGDKMKQEYPSTPEEAFEAGGKGLNFYREHHVIKSIPVPDGAPIYMTFDWGFAKPYSVGYWWVDQDNRIYRFGELYGNDKDADSLDTGMRQTDPEIAKAILGYEEGLKLGTRQITRLCDPTCFNKKPNYLGGGQGKSTADVFTEFGIYLIPGDPSRELKIRQFRNRLTLLENDRPMMQIYDTCTDFIRTIPLLRDDDKKPEDISTTMEDHIYDEACHICMARPISLEQLKPRKSQWDRRIIELLRDKDKGDGFETNASMAAEQALTDLGVDLFDDEDQFLDRGETEETMG